MPLTLAPFLDLFRGHAVTIPPMDGALQPNDDIEDATVRVSIDEPDNLATTESGVVFSSGDAVLVLGDAAAPPRKLTRFGDVVASLAGRPGGGFAVGLDDGRVIVCGDYGEPTATYSPQVFGGAVCPMALAFTDPATLLVAQGSARVGPADWAADLMSKHADGSLWRLDLGSGSATRLANRLAFPYGIAASPAGGDIVMAESWRHRLVRLRPGHPGAPEPVLDKLPGYPARLSAASGGGWWLAVFAPRNRLIEFVLGEDSYRIAMMRQIPPKNWIAPSLSAGASFLEPLQCGGVRSMGIHKPWAPARSYGLIVRLDKDFQPVASSHSRAGGRRHGVTSIAENDGRLLAAVKGGNMIIELPSGSPSPA